MAKGFKHGAGGGGAGGTLTVTALAGVTISVSKNEKTKSKTANASGVAVFSGLETGEWTVTISDGVQIASKSVLITLDYSVNASFNAIPDFVYTGDYEIVNDSDQPIIASEDNWKIRFLTSGVLTFSHLNGASEGMDVFCVGGGGGGNYSGGGGGYTTTSRNLIPKTGTEYEIVVGAGGGKAVSGGTTTAFGVTANGGGTANGLEGTNSQIIGYGGNGGSGGGASYGGSDGSDGGSDTLDYATLYGGSGQHTTTREFAETGAKLYSGGGGGQSGNNNSGGAGGGGTGSTPGETNTGGGGGYNSSGGSGIVIIRNTREVA